MSAAESQNIRFMKFWEYALNLKTILSPEDRATDAISLFLEIVGESNIGLHTVSTALLKWTQVMRSQRRFSDTKRMQLIRELHAVYKNAIIQGIIEDGNEFTSIINATKAEKTPSGSLKNFQTKCSSEVCREISKNRATSKSLAVATDVLMMSFFNRGETIANTAFLQKSLYETSLAQANALVMRNRLAEQQQYVFPLGQWRSREKKIMRDVESDIERLIAKFMGDALASEIAIEAWIETALDCGLTDAEIRAVQARQTMRYSYLNEICPAKITESRLREIDKLIANGLAEYTERWYVIALQRKSANKSEKVGNRDRNMTNAAPTIKTPFDASSKAIMKLLSEKNLVTQVFYPYETLVKRVGKRLKKYSRPFIAGFVFIKTSEQLIGRVEQSVKGYGVVLKSKADNGGNYLGVPDGEMLLFQKTVGEFTDDAVIEEIEMPMITEGDVIGIKGFGMENSFKVETLISQDSKKKTLTLLLKVANGSENYKTPKVLTIKAERIIR